jgi:hypothetical protein
VSAGVWAGAVEQVAGLHRAIVEVWRAPKAALACGALHLVSWLLGGVKVMLACHYLGHDVSLRQGIILESLSQAAGFAIPGGLASRKVGCCCVHRCAGCRPRTRWRCRISGGCTKWSWALRPDRFAPHRGACGDAQCKRSRDAGEHGVVLKNTAVGVTPRARAEISLQTRNV